MTDKANIKDGWIKKVRDRTSYPCNLDDSLLEELFESNYSVNEACWIIRTYLLRLNNNET